MDWPDYRTSSLIKELLVELILLVKAYTKKINRENGD